MLKFFANIVFLEPIEKLTEKLFFSISELLLGCYGLYKVQNMAILAHILVFIAKCQNVSAKCSWRVT